MHACTDGPQATNACGQSIYYLKSNYRVIVIIKLMVVIGSGVLAAFGADTSKGIGADIVFYVDLHQLAFMLIFQQYIF